MVRDINREPLADFYALVHWPYVRSKVRLLHRSGTLVSIWAKLHGSSWCAEMFFILRDSEDHALKADRSLIDSIMKLKPDRFEIQEYLHVCQYDSLIDTSRMPIWFTDRYKSYASGSVYYFDTDREVARHLVGVKHLTRLGTRHLFFETYHFCCWTGESLQSVLLSQASQLRERLTKCLMTWKGHWSRMDSSHRSRLLGQSQSIDL
jgi:hypothetical protein